MQQKYRDKIKQHFVDLVKNIDADVLADVLLEKRAFKKEEVEKILADRTDSKHNNRLLLFRILKKNDTVYEQFVEAMELFHLKHLFVNSDQGVRNRTATVFIKPRAPPIEDELPNITSLILNDSDNTIESPDLSTAIKPISNREPLVVKVTLAKKLQETDVDNNYDTTNPRRGQVLIINNDLFNPIYQKDRKGSKIDLKCLEDLFNQMYMKVEVHENIDVLKMKEVIQKFSKFDEDRISDICVVVIMSHGEERKNELVVLDRENNGLATSWIEEQFSNVQCTLFAGKPKVFLYQICRGKLNDYATTKQNNDVNENNTESIASKFDGNQLPEGDVEVDSGVIHAIERRLEDILVGHATQPGHTAHRDPNLGSWYIQTICAVFMANAHEKHIVQMLNEVDKKLKNYSTPLYTMQTSSYTSHGFNKFLYFNPGIYKDEDGNVQKFV